MDEIRAGVNGVDSYLTERMGSSLDPGSNSNHEGLLHLLTNELVKEEILSYLNFQDLKFFSEVSNDTLSAVRGYKGFRKKALLVIGLDAVTRDLATVKNFASNWKWKNVNIDAAISTGFFRSRRVKTLLMNVESITLHLSNEFRVDTEVYRFLKKILENAKNLKHLELDPGVLVKCGEVHYNKSCGGTLGPPFNCDLRNLETLQIMEKSTPQNPNIQWWKYSHYCMPYECFVTWLYQHISTLTKLKKLSSFYKCGDAKEADVQYGHPFPGSPDPDFTTDYAQGILQLIKMNRETLEELEIADIDNGRFKEIGNIPIKKLKRLLILASNIPGNSLKDFLAKQPELDSLNISVTSRLPSEIFNVVEEKQSNLKDLRVRVRRFDPPSGVDWTFLTRFSGLKCLVLRQVNRNRDRPSGYYGYGEDILHCIPSSVKILVIEGFKSFWRETTPEIDRNVWRRISHLGNLEQLSLHRCRCSLNDEGLQDLISNCPRLTALAFSHCYQLTKYGVTGVDANGKPTGVSLDQLKCLRHLSIRSCPGIQREDLLPIVKFDFLTGFYFDGRQHDEITWLNNNFTIATSPKKLHEDVITRLLSQNTRLESLGLRLPFSFPSDSLELKQMSRRLIHLNIQLPELQLENNKVYPSENDSALPLKRQ